MMIQSFALSSVDRLKKSDNTFRSHWRIKISFSTLIHDGGLYRNTVRDLKRKLPNEFLSSRSMTIHICLQAIT
jgi:hypothetical protein